VKKKSPVSKFVAITIGKISQPFNLEPQEHGHGGCHAVWTPGRIKKVLALRCGSDKAEHIAGALYDTSRNTKPEAAVGPEGPDTRRAS